MNPNVTQDFSYALHPALQKKRVAVVGGGVAGMEAARTAKLRGHEVELFEAEDHLGGHLNEAGSHPFKTGIARLNAWYAQRAGRLGGCSAPEPADHC